MIIEKENKEYVHHFYINKSVLQLSIEIIIIIISLPLLLK